MNVNRSRRTLPYFAAGLAALAASASAAQAHFFMLVHGMVQFSNITTGPLAGVGAETPVFLQIAFEENPVAVPGVAASRYAIVQEGSYIRVGEGANQVMLPFVHFHPEAQFQISNGWPDSDSITTMPEVIPLEGSAYTFRFEAHKYLTGGSLWDSTSATDIMAIYEHHDFDHVAFTIYNSPQGMLVMPHEIEITGGSHCDSIDFNDDHIFPDTLDIEDFLSVFAGGPCSNDPHCGDIDFNNDTIFPDSADVEMLLLVYAGGQCDG